MLNSNHFLLVAILLGVITVLSACSQEERLDDLSDASFEFVDHDSTAVTFPSDFEGNILVVGYVYTQCPDFCPALTGNMMNVRDGLENVDDVRFLTVTFDPERDTPSVLRGFRDAYRIADEDWRFLTGENDEIDAFMERMGVRYEIAEGSEERGAGQYLINHSDRITLIDQRGRVVMEYSGSRTPWEYIVEDIEALQEST